jgi:hypothetical protein
LSEKVKTNVCGDIAGPLAPAAGLVSAGATGIDVMKASKVGDPAPAVARKPGSSLIEPPASHFTLALPLTVKGLTVSVVMELTAWQGIVPEV